MRAADRIKPDSDDDYGRGSKKNGSKKRRACRLETRHALVPLMHEPGRSTSNETLVIGFFLKKNGVRAALKPVMPCAQTCADRMGTRAVEARTVEGIRSDGGQEKTEQAVAGQEDGASESVAGVRGHDRS